MLIHFYCIFLYLVLDLSGYQALRIPRDVVNGTFGIRNGSEVTTNTLFPFQALIVQTEPVLPICGGAIVNTNKVLTSASCALILQNNLDAYRIFVGNVKKPIRLNDTGEHGRFCELSRIHLLEGYSPPKNDLALIEVSQDFPSDNDYIKPVDLISSLNGINTSDCVFISWWAAEDYDGDTGDWADNLLYHNVGIEFDSLFRLCQDLPEGNMHLFCIQDKSTGDAGIVSSKNDKGSPMVCDGKLVGIAPDYSSNQTFTKGYITDIASPSYYDWIKEDTATTTIAISTQTIPSTDLTTSGTASVTGLSSITGSDTTGSSSVTDTTVFSSTSSVTATEESSPVTVSSIVTNGSTETTSAVSGSSLVTEVTTLVTASVSSSSPVTASDITGSSSITETTVTAGEVTSSSPVSTETASAVTGSSLVTVSSIVTGSITISDITGSSLTTAPITGGSSVSASDVTTGSTFTETSAPTSSEVSSSTSASMSSIVTEASSGSASDVTVSSPITENSTVTEGSTASSPITENSTVTEGSTASSPIAENCTDTTSNTGTGANTGTTSNDVNTTATTSYRNFDSDVPVQSTTTTTIIIALVAIVIMMVVIVVFIRQ